MNDELLMVRAGKSKMTPELTSPPPSAPDAPAEPLPPAPPCATFARNVQPLIVRGRSALMTAEAPPPSPLYPGPSPLAPAPPTILSFEKVSAVM